MSDSLDTPTEVRVAADALVELAAETLEAVGVAPAAAWRVAGALVDADLDGVPSHGVMLLPMYVDRLRKGSVRKEDGVLVVSDRDAVVVLDAEHGLGHVTADHAMGTAIDRARAFGLGLVAVRHAFHFGMARRYTVRAAAQGCVGVAMSNTRPLMPPPGGAERLVGNNPISVAIPTSGDPIALDIALSEVAMGRVRMAERTGEPIPPTWATDGDGVPTTDPAEAVRGMLQPAAGHKGFGLAVVVDLLCGLLSGGRWGDGVQPLYGDPAVPYDCSHLFVAIDVDHARPRADFEAEAWSAAERIRRARRTDGTERLYAPGDPERLRRQAAGGMVALAPPVADALRRCAQDIGVEVGDRLAPTDEEG